MTLLSEDKFRLPPVSGLLGIFSSDFSTAKNPELATASLASTNRLSNLLSLPPSLRLVTVPVKLVFVWKRLTA